MRQSALQGHGSRGDVQCAQCGRYIDPFASFVCKGCRRRPLCMEHQDPQYRVCLRCAKGIRGRKLREARSGLRSAHSFMRFSQFLFIVLALIFGAQRLLPDLSPDFVWNNFFVKHIVLWIALSAAAMVLTFVLYLLQRGRVRALEAEIGSSAVAYAHRIR